MGPLLLMALPSAGTSALRVVAHVAVPILPLCGSRTVLTTWVRSVLLFLLAPHACPWWRISTAPHRRPSRPPGQLFGAGPERVGVLLTVITAIRLPTPRS